MLQNYGILTSGGALYAALSLPYVLVKAHPGQARSYNPSFFLVCVLDFGVPH